MTRPTALITGASAGIGQELARVFAARGYDLIICARREERLQALADELSGTATVHIVTADLSKAKGPAKLISTVGDMGLTVDVLVNNAGTAFQGEFKGLPGQRAVEAKVQGHVADAGSGHDCAQHARADGNDPPRSARHD